MTPYLRAISLLLLGFAATGNGPLQARVPAQASATAPREAELRCPSELGIGLSTKRRFCDVVTGRDPRDGILITIPPHRGPVVLTFDLHNRHTYSAELVAQKRAYREYTATIGVLTMDNTLISRAVVRSEFRTDADLFDRIGGGAGPGGMKAVAPTGAELIRIELPATVGDQVSVLGENLTVVRPDGTDHFSAPGRPVATISDVRLEYRPVPAPTRRAPAKKKRPE